MLVHFAHCTLNVSLGMASLSRTAPPDRSPPAGRTQDGAGPREEEDRAAHAGQARRAVNAVRAAAAAARSALIGVAWRPRRAIFYLTISTNYPGTLYYQLASASTTSTCTLGSF